MKRWYVPLILLVITAFVPWVKEVRYETARDERARTEMSPVYSLEKAQAEFRWIKDRETEWVDKVGKVKLPDNPAPYWEYLERLRMLEDGLFRLAETTLDFRVRNEAQQRLKALTTVSPVSIINANFREKFGSGKMLDVKPKGAYFERRTGAPQRETQCLQKFVQGYLWSIIPMFFVFILRLRTRDLMIWPEIPRLVLASAFYPAGLFVYPKDIRRAEQIKWAMHFVAQMASVAVGFFGGGMANLVKAQTPGPNGKGLTKQGQKKSGSHTFGTGLEFYPQTSGIDAGLLVSPWYSHSHVLPKGFSLSGFGFVEMGWRKNQLFTNNSLNLSHAKSGGAMFSAEFGGSATTAFIQVGPRFNLVKIPGSRRGASKVVKSVVVGSLWRIRGPTHYREWFLSWVSKEAPLLGGWKLSSEGFMRFRPGSRAAAGQPQLIIRHPRIPHTQFLSEFWMIGTQPTVRLGVQFAK